MGMYRMTLLFSKKTGDPVGHSERWDFTVGSDSQAVTLGSQLGFRRAQFLPLDWKLQTIRVGTLASFQTVSHGYRFKQTSVQICNPPNQAGTTNTGEIDGGAVYYRFNYVMAPGRSAIRLFTPIPENWWNGGGSGGSILQSSADGEIQPFARWLQQNGHNLFRINKTTGSVTAYALQCVNFQRAAQKKVGRPFFLRRGRRFAHRTPRP